MALADGDRPVDGDYWFRVLTSSSHCARGRVSHGAFKGGFMRAAPAERPWDAEASGRLRSLAGTREHAHEHAVQYCKDNNGTFNGYMIPNPEKPPLIGLEIHGMTLDIRFTPIPDQDTAHADLTFTGTIPAEKSEEQKKFLLDFPDYFRAIHDTVWFTLPGTTVPGPNGEPAPPPALPDPVHRAAFITDAIGRALRGMLPKKD